MAQRVTMLSLLVGASAHVSMVYLDGQVGSIRNANGATGNGGASVNSPCGGATQFGSNGVGIAQDGETVTLSMRYAAGHNGAFRMAFACGGGDGSALEADAAALTADGNACTVTGAASAYGAGQGGGATAIGQQAMDITCTLPVQNNAEPIDCIIGILDQRDWGGCVDISLASAADPLPPSPPPAPFVTSAGPYYFSTRGAIDTSAGEVAGVGTFSCCGLSSGSLTVPEYAAGDGTTVIATFSADAQAENCPATTPIKTVAPPPNTGTQTLTGSITLTASEGGNKLSGTTQMAGQPFEVIVNSGSLSFTNVGGDQPIICDGGFSANDADGGSSGVGSGGDDGFSTFGKAAIAIVIILVVIIAFLAYRKIAGGGKRGSPQLTGTQMNLPPPPKAPPPPTAGPGLPPGWSAAVDPASGATYYVNNATGASQWNNPSNGV